MPRFRLRFRESQIAAWAKRYDAGGDYEVEVVVAPKAKARGFFTKGELQVVCRWKSPRAASRVAENDEAFVQEVTRASLASKNEQFQIEVLTLLSGVSWPSASVLLHFAARQAYPILDFRALWSLGVAVPSVYTYRFWAKYARYCRRLSHNAGVTMRELDRALWQFSKDHQRS